MNEEFTHWKKEAQKTYLGSWDLISGVNENNKPIYMNKVVTVKSITKEKVVDMEKIKNNPKATKEEMVVYFKEFEKPMILHAKTNFKGMEKATGTPFIEKWTNKQVLLYVEIDVKAFGNVTDALRLKACDVRICDICGNVMTENAYQYSISKTNGKAYCSNKCKEKGETNNE